MTPQGGPRSGGYPEGSPDHRKAGTCRRDLRPSIQAKSLDAQQISTPARVIGTTPIGNSGHGLHRRCRVAGHGWLSVDTLCPPARYPWSGVLDSAAGGEDEEQSRVASRPPWGPHWSSWRMAQARSKVPGRASAVRRLHCAHLADDPCRVRALFAQSDMNRPRGLDAAWRYIRSARSEPRARTQMTIAVVLMLALAAGMFLLGTSMASSAQGRYTIDSGASDPEGQYNQFAAAAGLPLRQSVALGCMGDPDPGGCTLRKQWDDLATLSFAKNGASMVQTAGVLVGLVAVGLLLFVRWPQRLATVAPTRAGTAGLPATPRQTSSTPMQGGLQREALAEALRREPSLADAKSPEDLAALGALVDVVESELSLKRELESLKQSEAKEASRIEAEQQVRATRAAADAQRRAQDASARVARDEQAARDRAARDEHLASLSPARRWLTTHRAQVAITVGLCAFAVVGVGGLWISANQTRNREDLAAAAASAASASAAASSASVSASASAAAAASSASASASASAEAVAQAAKASCAAAVKKATASLAGCDLSGANLAHLDLSGRNLAGANLSNANLLGATLRGANLQAVTWSGAVCPNGVQASGAAPCGLALAKPGSAANPLVLGQSVRVGDWNVAVLSVQANAKSNAIATADGFTDNPAPGYVYAILHVRLTWMGAGTGNGLDVGFDVNDVSHAGNVPGCVLTTDYDIDNFLLTKGQTDSGTSCFYMETAKTKGGLVGFSAGTAWNPLGAYWSFG